MRPFLTFSVPGISMDELKGKSFTEIDWANFVSRCSQEADPTRRAMRMQMIGLEASKMAAKTINDSFSTFNKLSAEGVATTADGRNYAKYTGVYFGAEMVRVGDPVRVTTSAPGPGSSAAIDPALGGAPADAPPPGVMLVSEVGVTSNGVLQFKGNVYRVVRAALPVAPNTMVPPETLGAAFLEEQAIRNQIEPEKGRAVWGWILVERDATRAEGEVHGRFYVTHKLMSIIDRERFEQSVQKGVVEDAQTFLNNRQHSGLGTYIAVRRETRAATIGAAAPVTFKAPLGMVED
jgi:hypothetical protein